MNLALWTRCRITASRGKPLRDRFEELLGVGPFPAVELGVDHLVVEGDLEGRPPPAIQTDADLAREPVGDRLPETSGLGEIVSNRAVFDRDHAGSVVSRGDGLSSPGVAARSPPALHALGTNLTVRRQVRRLSRGSDAPSTVTARPPCRRRMASPTRGGVHQMRESR